MNWKLTGGLFAGLFRVFVHPTTIFHNSILELCFITDNFGKPIKEMADVMLRGTLVVFLSIVPSAEEDISPVTGCGSLGKKP
jgi:hypothetical protein